ncbi:MAG: hypothetical protein M5U34_21515 [Chloroflexi bacterium]|nr:hypothetical protein [Chloroflexota bacterium]
MCKQKQQGSSTASELDIITKAFLVDRKEGKLTKSFQLMPVSHLHPSMIVAIEKNGNIIEDEIISITKEAYQGQVYDFEVAELHNYIADRRGRPQLNLQVARRRFSQHPTLPGSLPRRPGRLARTKLPLPPKPSSTPPKPSSSTTRIASTKISSPSGKGANPSSSARLTTT